MSCATQTIPSASPESLRITEVEKETGIFRPFFARYVLSTFPISSFSPLSPILSDGNGGPSRKIFSAGCPISSFSRYSRREQTASFTVWTCPSGDTTTSMSLIERRMLEVYSFARTISSRERWSVSAILSKEDASWPSSSLLPRCIRWPSSPCPTISVPLLSSPREMIIFRIIPVKTKMMTAETVARRIIAVIPEARVILSKARWAVSICLFARSVSSRTPGTNAFSAKGRNLVSKCSITSSTFPAPLSSKALSASSRNSLWRFSTSRTLRVSLFSSPPNFLCSCMTLSQSCRPLLMSRLRASKACLLKSSPDTR